MRSRWSVGNRVRSLPRSQGSDAGDPSGHRGRQSCVLAADPVRRLRAGTGDTLLQSVT